MREYAKPTKFGGYRVVEDKAEATKVVYDIEEDAKNASMMAAMGQSREIALQEAAAARREKDESAEQYEHKLANLRYAMGELTKERDAACERADYYQEQAEYYKGLNKTLLLMAKKRANADRDLRPKTTHTGYAVVSSVEKDYGYYTEEKKGNKTIRVKNTVTVWETTLQTPFGLDFTEEQVRQETQWLHKNENGWLIGKLGINSVWETAYEDMISSEDGEKYAYERNTWFRTRYRINARDGYWELLITHTKCITGIPPEMMPAQKKKKAGKKEENSSENE